MDPSDGNRPIIVPAGGGTTLDVLGVTHLFLAVPAGVDAWFDAIDQASQAGTLDDARYAQLSHDFNLEWLE